MTCLLTIIAFNFWFVKPTIKYGSYVATTSWTSLSQDLYSLYLIDCLIYWGCLDLLFQIFLFLLRNIQNHITLKKVFVHPYPLESYWLFSHGILIFLWDLVLKKNSYFTTSLSRPPYNGTFFAISVGSALPHVCLPSPPYITLFDCI